MSTLPVVLSVEPRPVGLSNSTLLGSAVSEVSFSPIPGSRCRSAQPSAGHSIARIDSRFIGILRFAVVVCGLFLTEDARIKCDQEKIARNFNLMRFRRA